MTFRLTAAALAVLVVAGTASAQTPPPDQARAERQRPFTKMCRDRAAHVSGQLAFLEIKLALTDQQKPLFERWKKVKLAAARSADCTPPPVRRPSIIDGLKHEEKMLRQRLDELQAERPALEALVTSLSDKQKRALVPPHGPRPFGPHPGGPGGIDADAPPPEI